MKNRIILASLLVATLGFAFTSSCAKVQEMMAGGTGGIGIGGTGGHIILIGSGGAPVTTCGSKCNDLPSTPILDTGVPANAATMFSGTPPTTGGPCISEPEDGTLFPNNWMRPRIKFTNPGGTLAQITLHANNQANDLVAYTMSDTWIVPKDVWIGLRAHQSVDKVTITVWLKGGGASTSTFSTATVPANGSLVFWAAQPSQVDKNLDKDCSKDANGQPVASCYQGDSELRGFHIGDETTQSVLTIAQVQQTSQDNNNKTSKVRCIGCHTGTPTGDFVAFNDAWPWRGVMAGVTAMNVGTSPAYMTQGGLEDMLQPALGVMTFSAAHWSETERLVVTSYSMTSIKQNDWYNAPNMNPSPNLAWFDLGSPAVPLVNGNGNFEGDVNNPTRIYPVDGVNMGFITRTGDSRGAATPNWSHDGTKIAYASTNAALDGHLDNLPVPNPNPNNEIHHTGHSDIWTVPFGNRTTGAGGTATPVTGADTTMYEEYFPAFSPDDALIAFNRVPANDPMYANPNSEIAVIRADGSGGAFRLRANQPPACTNKVSPGVNNHWPKWSPEVQAGPEGKVYWIVFSSNRADIPPVASNYGAKRQIKVSQLYVAPVIVTETGIKDYPAIYLWNQPTTTVNTTPAWQVFQIPMVE